VGGYRQGAAPEPEPPDAELICATELHRRADRIRRLILAPSLIAGIGLGVFGYLALRELFFMSIHAHQPYVTGLLTMLPAFVGSLRAARWCSDAIVRARVDGWTTELAREHQIAVDVLEDHVRLIRGRE
jgi:hypothetical protein